MSKRLMLGKIQIPEDALTDEAVVLAVAQLTVRCMRESESVRTRFTVSVRIAAHGAYLTAWADEK